MKITKQQLKQIIKEELSKISEAGYELPKRKPEHVDYDEGHDDGFDPKVKRQQGRSKEYNEGYEDGEESRKEFEAGMGDKG